MTQDTEVRATIEAIYRSESRRVLATLIRLLGDFDLAEEALHDAFRAALEQWPRDGVPANPRAWLVSAGRFKAIDAHAPARAFRRVARRDRRELDDRRRATPSADDEELEDDRLRLIFTCCHPALRPTRRSRSRCARSAASPPRRSRAPSSSRRADDRAAHRAREGEDPRRAHSVPGAGARRAAGAARQPCCGSIYLVFNEGYSASSGRIADARRPVGRGDPPRPAARRVAARARGDRAAGADAAARVAARRARVRRRRDGAARGSGPLALEPRADRGRRRRWSSGRSRRGAFGPYTLQAAIAAVHAEAPTPAATDWARDRRPLRRAAAQSSRRRWSS